MRTRARTYIRKTFQNSEDLGQNIQEGAVNRRPIKASLLLTGGDTQSATSLGAISIHPADYVKGLVSSRKLGSLDAAIG